MSTQYTAEELEKLKKLTEQCIGDDLSKQGLFHLNTFAIARKAYEKCGSVEIYRNYLPDHIANHIRKEAQIRGCINEFPG